jgi:hypothetical protein
MPSASAGALPLVEDDRREAVEWPTNFCSPRVGVRQVTIIG